MESSSRQNLSRFAFLRLLRPLAGAEEGFSLIEVLATALITMLLAAGVATALIVQAHSSGDQQLRSQANTLVNQDQDRLRGMSDLALSGLASSGSATSQQTVGNETYTISSSAAYQTASGASSCASSSVDYFKITSKVSWAESFAAGSTQTVSADSLLSRPVTGQLETLVTDQTGAGLQGVSVTATSTSPGVTAGQSGATDSSGCSLFAGLAAANYNVTASEAGWVTPQNTATASSAVAVTNTGSMAGTAFTLGQAGSITASFRAASPSASGQADGVMYTGGGPGYPAVSGPGSTTTLPAATQTVSSLFPFESTTATPVYTNNYSVYAGQCSYQNPGSANVAAASVGPGASATATVNEPFLYVKSVQTNGSTIYSVAPSDIILTYSSGGCIDSYQANVAAPGSVNGLNQSAPSSGWLASPGQPYAASSTVLTVCADDNVSSTAATQLGISAGWHSGTATTANSSFTAMNPAAGVAISLNKSGQCVAQ